MVDATDFVGVGGIQNKQRAPVFICTSCSKFCLTPKSLILFSICSVRLLYALEPCFPKNIQYTEIMIARSICPSPFSPVY